MAQGYIMENFRQLLIETYQQTNQYGKMLGMELTQFDQEGIEYKLTVKPEHLATPITAHGGLVAGYMDGVLGLAALYVSSENSNLVSTVEFKINYISPVRIGDVLIGRGKSISSGKRIIVTEGKIFQESTGDLVAIATGTFNAYPYQKAGMSF